MAKFTNKLQISTTLGHNYQFGYSSDYNDVIEIKQKVDNSDAFINLITIDKSRGAQTLQDPKGLIIANDGPATAEVHIKFQGWENDSDTDTQDEVTIGGSSQEQRYATFLLPPNEFTYLSNIRFVGYDDATSAANAGDGLNTNVSPADVNSGSEFADTNVNLNAKLEDDATALGVADLGPFRVGDLVQVGINTTTATRIEIMKVTAMSGTNGSGTLTVVRGLHGTSIADGDAQTDGSDGAVSGANVYFPFFNAYHDFDAFSTCQTDSSGRLKLHNLFGKFRTNGESASGGTGIVPGSFSMKFYNPGYIKWNLNGVNLSQSTGLATGTTYKMGITIDGGSADDVEFTTDSADVSFGNVMTKMQNALNEKFTSGTNLKHKAAVFSIVDGDLRLTSSQRLTTSAVAVANGSDGTTPFGVGRFPAAATCTAVSAVLPEDTIRDARSFTEEPNMGAFAYDDGKGRIQGVAEGIINYETGFIDIVGPKSANFVFSANGNSAHSGGINSTATFVNTISRIKARSVNQKTEASIRLIAFN